MIQIIRLKDDLEKDIKTFNDLTKDDAAKALSFAQKVLESGSVGLADILEYYDVLPYKTEDNKFNPLRQTVVRKAVTTDETLFKTVSTSIGDGYERNGRVVSKERVAAYVVEKTAQPAVQEV
ncbi:MAG: hypothetical protein LBH74_00720 [Nitrososphaerota archaeon]|jgi:molecular chaperone GrpE (heat shock protein)|nr:hypothetical protein [Nitrososphaerota archaeon]